MTDKVQKIKEWIGKEMDGLMDGQGNFEYPEHEGAYHVLCNLDAYIESLQEEPVSEDLEKEFEDYLEKNKSDDGYIKCYNGDPLGSEGDYYRVAKHFFELGLKSGNPTTAADRGMAEEI